uniref:NUDIX domain-containing protein n=1 Tax=Sphingomonas bacterium TaxID=1895847 RepID=UPI002614EF78|nr:NUDIX domain-containing protein [Sphingomonas bacterium]
MLPAIPASTLVLFRERAGTPELLMVERAKAMAFAAGALVFPGGRIDPGDHELAATLEGDVDDLAARIAAIRETIEEVGLPVGLTRMPAPDAFAALRRSLHAGTGLGPALDAAGLTLDPLPLVPFARWRPNHPHSRIFDTRFYLARLPDDSPEPVVDDTENSRVFWMSAQGVLDEADAGRARIIFPTRRNLERLAQLDSFDAAAAHAAAIPVRTVTPWIEQRDGERHLCIPDDLGYPVTSENLESAERG